MQDSKVFLEEKQKSCGPISVNLVPSGRAEPVTSAVRGPKSVREYFVRDLNPLGYILAAVELAEGGSKCVTDTFRTGPKCVRDPKPSLYFKNCEFTAAL